MLKTNYQTILLDKGEMHIYDFGEVKLHAYRTNDLMNDEVFIFEKSGKAVILELPCFKDNIRELTDYIQALRVELEGKLVAYHAVSANFLPNVPTYMTSQAKNYGLEGAGKAMVSNFSATFGEAFDGSIVDNITLIEPGEFQLADLRFRIIATSEAFNVEIPEIQTIYTHMLGHNCHSIVTGFSQIDAMLQELKTYLAKGYELILSSHYTPEDLKDVEEKIAYLQDLKKLAAVCDDQAAFKQKVLAAYPEYAGANYLDMSADCFFPND